MLTVPSRLGCQLGHCLVPTLQAFADALRVNHTVRRVDLSNNKFGDDGLKARPRQRAIPWKGGNHSYAVLHCMLDSAHDATKSSQLFNAQALADALLVNHTVRRVDLNNNKFGDDGLKARPPQRPRLSRRKRDSAQPLCALGETCDRTTKVWDFMAFLHHVVVCVHFISMLHEFLLLGFWEVCS